MTHTYSVTKLLCQLAVATLCCLNADPARSQTAPERPSGWTVKQAVHAKRDMIATANPLATEAGAAILAAGGSAVDAAIAAQLVLNLVEPQSSGLGGGAFILYHHGKTGKLQAFDGRETAPAAAKPERFLGSDGKPLTGDQ